MPSPVLTELIKKKARFESRVIKAVTVGDIALLYTDFQGTILDASQQMADVLYRAIAVLRRHRDDSWKLMVGDPSARK